MFRTSISCILFVISCLCLTTFIYFILSDRHVYTTKLHKKISSIASTTTTQQVGKSATTSSTTPEWMNSTNGNNKNNGNAFRILHVITTSSEYNSDGTDRLKTKLIPTLRHTLDSILIEEGWEVDVYLILGYKLTKEKRKRLIEESLPDGVGLEIWDHATPYAARDNIIQEFSTYLGRQHRFVIKDKLEHYDIFSCWEDDMRVTAEHIKVFLYMSNELDRLRDEAKKKEEIDKSSDSKKQNSDGFRSALTVDQIDRVLPGFIRVEVLKSPSRREESATPSKEDPIPFHTGACCAPPTIVHHNSFNQSLLTKNHPNPNDVVLWETAIQGISLRYIPNSSFKKKWVALLPSGNPTDPKASIRSISTYPKGGDANAKLFAQQGGWMLTQKQIKLFDTKTCQPGGYLPPYNNTSWKNNGLQHPGAAVEFWSGGFHLFLNCNVKRMIFTNRDLFARQLVFHTSLNKQFQRSDRLVSASTLLSQISRMIPQSSSLDDVKVKV